MAKITILKNADGDNLNASVEDQELNEVIEIASGAEEEIEHLVTSDPCMTKKSVEFIRGKRRINLSDISMRARKQNIIEALIKSRGVRTPALRAAGVSFRTFYRYYDEDAMFKDNVDTIKTVALDFAETQLFKNIAKGFEASIFFYLKTQGKERGYTERIDLGIKSGDLSGKTDKELDDEIERLRGRTTAALNEGEKKEAG